MGFLRLPGRWLLSIMRALMQRVTRARVLVGEQVIGEIASGLLVLVAVQRGDTEDAAERLLRRVLGYRVFADAQGRMNLSLGQVGGGLLLVSQFTLAADTRKGMRPSLTPAAAPEEAERLFDLLLARARELHSPVACGKFGAHMQVESVNDGPVTFLLETAPG